jgi:hypothetical protein
MRSVFLFEEGQVWRKPGNKHTSAVMINRNVEGGISHLMHREKQAAARLCDFVLDAR